MSGTEARRRTPARELLTGALLILVVGEALMLIALAIRQNAWGLGWRRPAPARAEIQPPARAGIQAPVQQPPRAAAGAKATKALWDESTVELARRVIESEHGQNLAAIAAAKLRLDGIFSRCSERVPQFTDALNSLGEKARVAKSLVWPGGNNETEQEAARLFAEDVVPLDALRRELAGVVEQFKRDAEANHKIVLSSVGPDFVLPDVPFPAAMAGTDLLLTDFTGQLGRFIGSQAEAAPTSSVNSLVSGVVVADATRKKVIAAMEARDSEPKRAAAVGTAAGMLAGALDYWLMQSRFESEQTRRCQEALDKIRDALWTNPENGLEASFTRYADLLRDSELLALKRAGGK